MEMMNFPGMQGFTGLLLGPKPISSVNPIDNRVGIIVGGANSAAGIVAEIASRYPATNAGPWEPPVGTWWISGTDGSLWLHASQGVTANNWRPGVGGMVQAVTVNIPTASLQAGGVVVVPNVAGRAITVLSFALSYAAISGTGVTGLYLQDDAGTPVVSTTDTTLTAGTVYDFTAGVSLGAGYCKPLTVGKDLVLAVDGTAANFTCAGGVNVTISFMIK